MKLFSETVIKNPNDPNSKNESKYDQKVPVNEVEEFEKDMIEKIYAKAKEFGIKREELDDLNDNFDSYYMIGARLYWNIWDWGKVKREKQVFNIQNSFHFQFFKIFPFYMFSNFKTLLSKIPP